MIKNERQYRITRAQMQNFEQALEDMNRTPIGQIKGVEADLRRLEMDALSGQLQDLRAELRAYEALRSADQSAFAIESLEELPRTLIKARIASGLTQRELAERLGLKEQQIQRYEASDYQTASLARLLEIARALGIKERKRITAPKSAIALQSIFKRLESAGLERAFIEKRFIAPQSASLGTERTEDDVDRPGFVYAMTENIGRVFGWSADEILGHVPLELNVAAAGEVSFKLPSRVEARRLNAYVLYAHYLALLVLEGTPELPRVQIPADYDEVRKAILSGHGQISCESVLRYVWASGVPVLPLRDPGAFHGACWRVEGRNVIVLKQRTRSQARWLFDLLHELWHVAGKGEQANLSVIEASPTSPERRSSPEEEEASRFAGDVILAGRAEELAELCVKEAQGRVEWLKRAVPRVAHRENVAVDSLANYIAFRLSLQDINWWGAAENLQAIDSDPWSVSRDLLLKNCSFGRLNDTDRNLLMLALAGEED